MTQRAAGQYPESDIRVATFVEIHPLLQRHFGTDNGVTHITDDRIFAGDMPDDTELPAIQFRFPQISSFSQPAPLWWTHTGQVDCFADTELEADRLGIEVQRSLMRLQQSTHLEGVVGTVSAWDVDSALDYSRTPPTPRRIVSVTLTARRNS